MYSKLLTMRKLILLLCLFCISCISSSQETLHLGKEGELCTVDMILNNKIEVPFIIDTGCSTSSMPFYIVYTLSKTGTIYQEDLLEDTKATLADGSEVVVHRLLIKRVKIGNVVLNDVVFSVSENPDAPLLLGQNILKELGEVTINYKNNTLSYEKN